MIDVKKMPTKQKHQKPLNKKNIWEDLKLVNSLLILEIFIEIFIH